MAKDTNEIYTANKGKTSYKKKLFFLALPNVPLLNFD